MAIRSPDYNLDRITSNRSILLYGYMLLLYIACWKLTKLIPTLTLLVHKTYFLSSIQVLEMVDIEISHQDEPFGMVRIML